MRKNPHREAMLSQNTMLMVRKFSVRVHIYFNGSLTISRKMRTIGTRRRKCLLAREEILLKRMN
jgi:hypothetical protein